LLLFALFVRLRSHAPFACHVAFVIVVTRVDLLLLFMVLVDSLLLLLPRCVVLRCVCSCRLPLFYWYFVIVRVVPFTVRVGCVVDYCRCVVVVPVAFAFTLVAVTFTFAVCRRLPFALRLPFAVAAVADLFTLMPLYAVAYYAVFGLFVPTFAFCLLFLLPHFRACYARCRLVRALLRDLVYCALFGFRVVC